MAFITDILNTIKNARKGKDMRQAIYDGIQQCYKDATGHPDSVAAVVERLKIEKGRIDELATSQTFTGNYTQSNLVFHAYRNAITGDPDPDDSYNYEGTSGKHEMPICKIFQEGTLDFAEKQSNEKVKILKEGLYIFELRIFISGSGKLDIEARINDVSQRYNAWQIVAQSTEETKIIAYILYLKGDDVVSFYGTPGLQASVRAPVSDVNCYVLDWIGKAQISDCSKEISDIRVGEDGAVYGTAGEAVRKQIGNLTEDLGNTKSQLDESIADIGNGFTTGFFTPATVKISDTRSSINPENGEISTGYRPMTNIIKALLHRNIKIHTAEENYYHIVFEYDEKMHFVRSLGWNKSSIAEYDLKSGNNYIVSFDSPKLPNNNNSPSVEDARRIYTVTMNSNTKVAELDSKIKDTTPKNLIGNELNKTYSVNIPKGTLFTISTSDGSTIERENFKVNVIYSDGTEDYWTIKIGTSERTISDTKDIVGLYLTETLNVPIQVEIGNKTEYEEHFDNVKDINKRVDAIETKNDGFLLPSYLSGEYENTINTIKSNKAEDTVLFGIMTDLHIPSINSGYNLYLRNGVIYSMKALSNMTKDMRFDFVSFLGDYEQFPTKANGQTKQMGFDVLLEINDYIAKMNTKALAIQGNHEANYTGGGDSYGMSDEEFFKYCTEQSVYRNGIITDGTHCYYDDDKNRLRYVFINSASENVDPTVTSFLQRMADTKYDVIVLSHFGGDSGVLYDSTKLYIDTLRTNGANVILWLSGHSHQDWHYVYNKCLIISFLQSGFWTSSPSENGINYEHETGNSNYCAFTAVLLNRKDKKVHCIRFGLGIDYTYDII